MDLFVGVDLAAQDAKTGLAVVSAQGRGVRVESTQAGADDAALIEVVHLAVKAGIDTPLGWPAGFVDFIAAQARGWQEAPADTGLPWRREMTLRVTDQEIHRRLGLSPLSVAANLIAHPALRWAGLEPRLREAGVDVARDGSGQVCEVYPAAALKVWGRVHRGYKGAGEGVRQVRAGLVAALAQAGLVDWAGWEGACVDSDDAFDAVVAAVVAWHVAGGGAGAVGPDARHREMAAQEGWIWVPRPQP